MTGELQVFGQTSAVRPTDLAKLHVRVIGCDCCNWENFHKKRQSPPCRMAWAVLKCLCMKMRNSIGKKRAARVLRRDGNRGEMLNLPRLFLFFELFVDKDIPERSTK